LPTTGVPGTEGWKGVCHRALQTVHQPNTKDTLPERLYHRYRGDGHGTSKKSRQQAQQRYVCVTLNVFD